MAVYRRKRKIALFLTIVLIFSFVGEIIGSDETPAPDDSGDTFDQHFPPPPIPVVVENQDGPCDDCGCFVQSTF